MTSARNSSGLVGTVARSHIGTTIRVERSGTRYSDLTRGAAMTTIQAVILGMMLVLTPSLILLAVLVWREGIGLTVDETDFFQRPHR